MKVVHGDLRRSFTYLDLYPTSDCTGRPCRSLHTGLMMTVVNVKPVSLFGVGVATVSLLVLIEGGHLAWTLSFQTVALDERPKTKATDAAVITGGPTGGR